MHHEPVTASEEGVVLLTLVTTLVPLLMVVATFTSVLTSHTREQRLVLDQEGALMAAESGIDDAIYRGQIGTLKNGMQTSRRLSGGSEFTITATHLGKDGIDNDNDGDTDEDDEDVFQVVSEGSYRTSVRRIAAYLGPVALLPTFALTGAVAVYNPSINIDLRGTPRISGADVDLSGSPTGSSAYGMTVASPGTVSELTSTISKKEANKIQGTGGAPSLATAAAQNLATMVDQIKNAANVVLTANKYSGASLGNGSLGQSKIIYRNGDVTFTGNGRGAGVMLVTGNLELKGSFRFDGVIIVLGDFNNSGGTADVYGGVILGPASSTLGVRGNLNVHYSTEGLALANGNSGKYVSFNGWQELPR